MGKMLTKGFTEITDEKFHKVTPLILWSSVQIKL